MYGILAACIAVMAMFLGLFAFSVDTDTKNLQDKLIIETAEAPVTQSAAK